MEEVIKAFQICPVNEPKDIWPNSSYCVGIVEAWEEFGYLFISSELCEKGNLNDYLI